MFFLLSINTMKNVWIESVWISTAEDTFIIFENCFMAAYTWISLSQYRPYGKSLSNLHLQNNYKSRYLSVSNFWYQIGILYSILQTVWYSLVHYLLKKRLKTFWYVTFFYGLMMALHIKLAINCCTTLESAICTPRLWCRV